jgi:hypothetical protein
MFRPFPDLLSSYVSRIHWTVFAFLTNHGQAGTKEKELITKARKYEGAKFWLFFFFVLSVFRVFVISF